MGRAPEPPAYRDGGLALDRGAYPSDSCRGVVRKRREHPSVVRNKACLPRSFHLSASAREGSSVTAVMIGVDPHKGSHTAVAVAAMSGSWAAAGPRGGRAGWAASRMGGGVAERTWAVEGASGLGHLVAQQLVAAGERVLDVQPKLAARVRLLASRGHEQDRPERRPVGRGRCAALWTAAARCGPMTTARSCRYGPSGTGTWPGPATRSPADCTR